jgi:hypothetical protein
MVIQDVFTSLSNLNGAAIARRVIALAQDGDPDFNRGADEAAIIQFYGMGRLKNEAENPIVQRATAVVKATGMMGATDPRAAIGGTMVTITFMREVETRFGIT